jgi:hypothetical protein
MRDYAENNTIDSQGTYELLKGTCSPEETFSFQVDLEKAEEDTYQEKKVPRF